MILDVETAPGTATQWDDLVDHLVQTTALPGEVARRVVEEVIAYCGETAEGFVRRRHRELQAGGRANAEIFRTIAAELATRPVAAPRLTERQIRRVIYG
jgi:polyhydroxyalkanoate synthesis regulator phasin